MINGLSTEIQTGNKTKKWKAKKNVQIAVDLPDKWAARDVEEAKLLPHHAPLLKLGRGHVLFHLTI